jgi:hypothetical protein
LPSKLLPLFSQNAGRATKDLHVSFLPETRREVGFLVSLSGDQLSEPIIYPSPHDIRGQFGDDVRI